MTSKPPPASWESLQQRPRGVSTEPPDHDTPEELVWRATSAGVGKDLLDWLRAEYIEKRNQPLAHEAQLREFEAERRLVARLEQMRDSGAEIARGRNKTP